VWALGGIKKEVFLFSFLLKEKKKGKLYLFFSSLIIVIYQTFFENSDFAES